MPPRQRKVFILHLSPRQSIGPQDLHALWSSACRTTDVAVSRNAPPMRDPSRPSYGLWAGNAFDRDSAEKRLRMMLDARGYFFSLTGIIH